MFQNIGFTELLLIAVVALVLFGPQKLPEIGRMLGKTLRDFKQAANELMQDEPKAPLAKPAPSTPVVPDPVSPVSMASVAATNAASEASTTRMAPEAKSNEEVTVVEQAAEAASQPIVKPAVAFRTNKSTDVVQVAGSPSEAKETSPSASAASTEQAEADVLSAVPATTAAQPPGSMNNARRLPD